MNFVSINPATGRVLRRHPAARKAAVDAAIGRAHRAYHEWRDTSPAERARRLRALSAVLHRRLDELAALATAEMGKPIVQAKAEVEKCRTVCGYYASRAAEFLADDRPPGAPRNARVSFAPIGVILAIMPWNFPYWQVLRAAATALAAGNAVLLKHSPNVSGCALVLEELFSDAGFPAGLFQTLLLRNDHVPGVIADPRVQGVTLTGSTRAGRIVGALAGQAVKKAVFELGGSDAYLILEDADIEKAAEICASSRLINSGQSCVCAKRFIVASSLRREFVERLVARMSARSVGDPTQPDTDVGPLARADLRETLDRQVQASIKAGARVHLGGHPISGPGFYYAPTVLSDVPKHSPAYSEELFGPVAAVIPARTEAQAVAIANDSPFGLGAAVFSRSRRRAEAVARSIDAGQVFINDFVRSDPTLPFGGVKQSGHGRELSLYGFREFLNIKTICGS